MCLERAAALDRVEAIIDAVESEPMPVPVREVWVYGDAAIGLDPVERLDVYLAKDLLVGDAPGAAPDREPEFRERHGIRGVGKTVSVTWAERFPEHLRANDAGYAAPERCLAAHLLPADDPVHLEVCNAGFEDNVTRRLQGALARETYEEILDPRGVCLWVAGEEGADRDAGGATADGAGNDRTRGGDSGARGTRDAESLAKLRAGDLPFPTLPDALEMLGVDAEVAPEAAAAVREYRADLSGRSVRGDVV